MSEQEYRNKPDPDPGWVPPHVDVERANPARVYDYWLGGAANFAVDREMAEHISAAEPGAARAARENRAFLRRAVRFCLARGVRQFLDLGSGIPTVGNVHEIAQETDPGARVSYVDDEPVAVAHSRQLLLDTANVTITRADLRDVDAVLGAPGVCELLDFERPVALLTVMALQYFPDTDALVTLLDEYRAKLVPGSYHVLSHLTDDEPGVDMVAAASRTREASHNAHPRDRAEVERLLGGAEPVPPGVVYAQNWHDDTGHSEAAAPSGVYAVVARIG